MRKPALTVVLLLALGTSAAIAARPHKHKSPPTRTEIRAAVKRAERSRQLWATVNICDTAKHHNVLGIRGQLPALGFPTEMSMLVQVDYYVTADRRFERDKNVRPVRIELSKTAQATGLWQGGVEFSFTPPADLSGTVTFQWKLGGRVIGHVTRPTVRGVKGVTHADPPGHSTATCTIRTP